MIRLSAMKQGGEAGRAGPSGALIRGCDRLHPIRVRFQRGAGEKVWTRDEVRHALATKLRRWRAELRRPSGTLRARDRRRESVCARRGDPRP